MKKNTDISSSQVGLAIFTMLFGAGNIIYPIKAGITAGSNFYITFLGFLATSILLPILGLITMILFDGNYTNFFKRIGRIPGNIAIAFCMIIIGPLLVMPRCITVPYEILAPLYPSISISLFSALFGGVAFLLAYKESKILDIMSKYISWFLLSSISFIIILGIWSAERISQQELSTLTTMYDQSLQGFQTLDLIGTLFFAYIIFRLIKLNSKEENLTSKKIALLCLKGSFISGFFMTFFYVGLGLLGAFYTHLTTPDMNGAEIFRNIAMHVVGEYGIIMLVIGVLMACISTLVALAAVFSEYLRKEIFKNKITYIQSLSFTMLITIFMSNFGLSNILKIGAPIINFGYPIIVMITLCNAAYKLFNFKYIKVPVLLATALMIWFHIVPLIA